MKTLKKIILLILLFGLSYVAIMTWIYDFLYEYPVGFLDELERADDARQYKLMLKQSLDKDTTLYFTRSNNGVGDKMHAGTVDSPLPNIIANFKCESTSSIYFPNNAYGYAIATDEQHTSYLFGATGDLNTVDVKIIFYLENNEKQVYDMVYESQCFYYIGFDANHANYRSWIQGFNKDGGITFQYGTNDPLSDGGFVARDVQS